MGKISIARAALSTCTILGRMWIWSGCRRSIATVTANWALTSLACGGV